ncbi:MAG: efflux RND transporter periplasmic adaptor subunit [Piscinibacter sp.]|nr:efflux RND transporter periplasmic adaptor subunit [Piscinibacter sp.]
MNLTRVALLCAALGGLATPLVARAQAASAAAASAPAAVQSQRYADAAVHPRREATAAVLARNESRISAEVPGRILRWHRDAGENVAKGEWLVEIDGADYRIARDRAASAVDAQQARLALAERQLARARELQAQSFVSPEVVNQRETEASLARAELASARQQLAAAELALARTRVAAPFAATVRQRLAQAGEVVAAGAPLYVLVERGEAEVAATLAPADAAGLRAAGAWVFEGADGRALALQLRRVSDVVSASSRSVEARFAFKGEAAAPGAEGRVRWQDARPHVPPAAMVRRDGTLGVFVVEGGRARFVPLPGAQEARAAPLALPADARLVVQGQHTLANGQAVPGAAASAAR